MDRLHDLVEPFEASAETNFHSGQEAIDANHPHNHEIPIWGRYPMAGYLHEIDRNYGPRTESTPHKEGQDSRHQATSEILQSGVSPGFGFRHCVGRMNGFIKEVSIV